MNASEIKAAQDNGKIVCVIDIARRFDVMAASAAGVDVSRLLVSQPDTVEQAREIAESVAKSGAVDIVVIIGGVGRWSLESIRAAARGNTEIRTVDADELPAPAKDLADVERDHAALVRKVDRKLRADKSASAMDRLAARVESINVFPETRPAHYGLAWGVGTGRMSSEIEAALCAMAPAVFARHTMRIATTLGGQAVRDIYAAWRDAAIDEMATKAA